MKPFTAKTAWGIAACAFLSLQWWYAGGYALFLYLVSVLIDAKNDKSPIS
jgi:hypothetical protein